MECGTENTPGHDCYFYERLVMSGEMDLSKTIYLEVA
jgi:hypothetical protein